MNREGERSMGPEGGGEERVLPEITQENAASISPIIADEAKYSRMCGDFVQEQPDLASVLSGLAQEDMRLSKNRGVDDDRIAKYLALITAARYHHIMSKMMASKEDQGEQALPRIVQEDALTLTLYDMENQAGKSITERFIREQSFFANVLIGMAQEDIKNYRAKDTPDENIAAFLALRTAALYHIALKTQIIKNIETEEL